MRCVHINQSIAFVLVIIGALDWGLIGFFDFDLVKAVFGDMTVLSRAIYGLIGIASIYLIIDSIGGKERV